MELSPTWWRQIQLTSKPWLLNEIVAWKHSVCSAVHLSKLRFDMQALNAWLTTFQLEISAPLSQKNSEVIFLHLQNISYPVRLTSWRLVSSRFVGRGLFNDITNWARSCLHCLQGKIHRHTCLLPQSIPIPQWQFAHLHITLVGPLQYSNDCNYIFTIIDRT
jgi:hypothetical protein